jgi:hypothetical protein
VIYSVNGQLRLDLSYDAIEYLERVVYSNVPPPSAVAVELENFANELRSVLQRRPSNVEDLL